MSATEVEQVQVPSVERVQVKFVVERAAAAFPPKFPTMVEVVVSGEVITGRDPLRRLESVAPTSHSPAPVPRVRRPSRMHASTAVRNWPVSDMMRLTWDLAT